MPGADAQAAALRADVRGNPGASLAGVVAVIGIAVHAVRSASALLHFGGDVAFITFNDFQAAMMLALVFLSMVWNFGFLLMAIDRLRAEVADLALVDDLTGVANRRHLLARMSEECALSLRSGEPFALLAIDLDGFKEINDGFGHGAGDECLRLFTGAAQSRLRPGDMLARAGGDEFCIVLPATTSRGAATIARRVLETCRESFARWEGREIPIAASIGIAQWSPVVGAYPERLIAAADQALYAAKKQGKNRYSVYEPAPCLAPELEAEAAPPGDVAERIVERAKELRRCGAFRRTGRFSRSTLTRGVRSGHAPLSPTFRPACRRRPR